MTINLVFANRPLEKQFAHIVQRASGKEEIGGILFWDWGQINNLHWAKHNRLFDCKSIAMISDWIICPNVSNLRDREYKVSDLKQLIGIAEQSSISRRCQFLHFHTHPNQSLEPSDSDKAFWDAHFSWYAQAHGVIASTSPWHDVDLACFTRLTRDSKRLTLRGRFHTWKWINYKLRKDAKERGR